MLSTDYDTENEAIQNIENSTNQLLEEGYILSKEVTDKQIANQFNTTVKSIQTIRSKHNK